MAVAARTVEALDLRLLLDEEGRVIAMGEGAALLLGGGRPGRRLDEEPGLLPGDGGAYQAWLAALQKGPYHAAKVDLRLVDGRVLEFWGINLLTAEPAALVVDVHVPSPSTAVGGVDRLTGLPDRAALRDLGDAAIRHAGPLPFGLLHLDLDRLKGINDTLGHTAGDLLLVEVARRVRSVLRSGDVLARLGGDEFVVMLPCAPPDVALAAAQRIERAMRAPFRVMGHGLHAQVSIGTACYPRDASTFEALLQCADMAMFHAKRNHLGRAAYEPHLGHHTRARVRIEAEIHRGLEAEEFELFYQPVLDLRGPASCRAEALMRWRHPTRGLILPGEFVSVAEDTGSIVTMDRWALLSAARQVRAWSARGLRVEVAVNLSARTFRDPALPAWLDTVLAETGVDPGQLGVEITESTAMGSTQETVARMAEFIGRGLTVALDDFGTGYSSLAYLKHFHVHVLKVDRSFVRGIGLEPRDEQLIEVVALLARSLGVRLVAEGVETEGQLRWLDDLGCDHIQGYTVARPMPATDVGRWWAGRELVR